MRDRPAQLSITLTSDFVCPWCFIGERRLSKAIGQLDGVEIRVNWRPFQLNPGIPASGLTLEASARNENIHGVPEFKIGASLISRAQTVSVLLDALVLALHEGSGSHVSH